MIVLAQKLRVTSSFNIIMIRSTYKKMTGTLHFYSTLKQKQTFSLDIQSSFSSILKTSLTGWNTSENKGSYTGNK